MSKHSHGRRVKNRRRKHKKKYGGSLKHLMEGPSSNEDKPGREYHPDQLESKSTRKP